MGKVLDTFHFERKTACEILQQWEKETKEKSLGLSSFLSFDLLVYSTVGAAAVFCVHPACLRVAPKSGSGYLRHSIDYVLYSLLAAFSFFCCILFKNICS